MTIRATKDDTFEFTLELGRRARQVAILEEKRHWRSRALLALGTALFEFENAIDREPRHRLVIRGDAHWFAQEQDALGDELERLIRYVLLVDAKVSFLPADVKYRPDTDAEGVGGSTFLFSGGVDSLCGAAYALSAGKEASAVFCAHNRQSRTISIVRKLSSRVLAPREVRLWEVPAPAMRTGGFSQVRGALYTLAGAAVALAAGSGELLVNESGPTMYQPRFAPSDRITMTTHPFVMERIRSIVRLLAGDVVTVLTPFEDLTKAEMMALTREGLDLCNTHSCVSQRLDVHDGTCFGCVVRRLAAIAADIPDVYYANDPITNPAAASGNLVNLLEFNLDVHAAREEMPWYRRELMEMYDKWDLFRRYGLDNFAALYCIREGGVQLAPKVDELLSRFLAAASGASVLEDRISSLR